MEKMIMRAARSVRRAAAVLLVGALAAGLFAGCAPVGPARRRAAALKMADWLLALQCENGAIPDAAGADSVNEDSNMEYALIALAAAYQASGQEKYRAGLAAGVAWLAAAQVTDAGPWRGSWWYRYTPAGSPLASPQADGTADVRGVDATSALFVYLLYLDQTCGGTAADDYRENAAAALDFVLTQSRTSAGFFAGSFLQDAAGRWSRADCCYAADQGDVWLGLRAGALLYGGETDAQAADFLQKNVPAAFFSAARGRYCLGLADGRQDWSDTGFGAVQCQGFLPWLWGATPQNRAAVNWLRQKRAAAPAGGYSLTAAFLLLGEQGIGAASSAQSAAWLCTQELDAQTGGVYDSPADRTETVNVAAFCILALLAWPAGV